MTKRVLACAASVLISVTVTPVAAVDVGVSITVGEPGFYGRIDIGDAPRPRVIYAEPRVIERTRVVYEPIYLHVPPGHAKDWRKHCKHYDACARPVYFVRNDWYDNVYVPHHKAHKGKGKPEHAHGKGPKHDKQGKKGGRD